MTDFIGSCGGELLDITHNNKLIKRELLAIPYNYIALYFPLICMWFQKWQKLFFSPGPARPLPPSPTTPLALLPPPRTRGRRLQAPPGWTGRRPRWQGPSGQTLARKPSSWRRLNWCASLPPVMNSPKSWKRPPTKAAMIEVLAKLICDWTQSLRESVIFSFCGSRSFPHKIGLRVFLLWRERHFRQCTWEVLGIPKFSLALILKAGQDYFSSNTQPGVCTQALRRCDARVPHDIYLALDIEGQLFIWLFDNCPLYHGREGRVQWKTLNLYSFRFTLVPCSSNLAIGKYMLKINSMAGKHLFI